MSWLHTGVVLYMYTTVLAFKKIFTVHLFLKFYATFNYISKISKIFHNKISCKVYQNIKALEHFVKKASPWIKRIISDKIISFFCIWLHWPVFLSIWSVPFDHRGIYSEPWIRTSLDDLLKIHGDMLLQWMSIRVKC